MIEDLVFLGLGFYDLETEPTKFRWTRQSFSIYIDKNLSDIEILLSCNKVSDRYILSYSLDNWKTKEIVELSNGNLILAINNDKGSKKIDFESSTFIPGNGDSRELGVQIHKIFYKTTDQKFYEINIDQIKFQKDILKPNKINENSFSIMLENGWHELEKDSFRWTNGEGILSLRNLKFDNLKFIIGSPHKTSLKISVDNLKYFSFNLKEGEQEVLIKGVKNCNTLSLISGIFNPISINNLNEDNRILGVQLFSIEMYNDDDNNFEIVYAKNLYFSSNAKQLIEFSKFNFVDVEYSEINSDGYIILEKFSDTYDGKFNLNDQPVFYTHRSGWSYAIESIKELHNKNGVIFDGFLERTFSWNKYKNITDEKIPIKKPWVGVIHNPMTNPFEKEDGFSTTKLLKSIVFMKSLDTCKGLYVLSNDLKNKLSELLKNIKIEFLYHPTIEPSQKFCFDDFLSNKNKRIINIGSWLRKKLSIYRLKTNFNKTSISPIVLNEEKLKKYTELEQSLENIKLNNDDYNSVEILPYQSSKDYDMLLSNNIAFMDFYDVSASNLVIECIVRNTPILIKRHSAIEDYLGKNYPMYFESLNEASEKSNDLNIIEQSYEYIEQLPIKKFLTGESFKKSIIEGQIYNFL